MSIVEAAGANRRPPLSGKSSVHKQLDQVLVAERGAGLAMPPENSSTGKIRVVTLRRDDDEENAELPAKGAELPLVPAVADTLDDLPVVPADGYVSSVAATVGSAEAWPGLDRISAAEVVAEEIVGVSSELLEASRCLSLWGRAKRLVLFYVRFFRAFTVLRDVHVPLELDTTLVKRMERLGEGCFAICSRIMAIDKYGVKRDMAMKLLKHGSGDQDVDDFIREREVLKKIRHSRVVSYFDSGHIQLPGMHFPEMYLAMEYMPGGSIRDIILKQMDSPHRKVYSKLDAHRWLLDIARALEYLHTRSPCVVHRDLKPENIMLSSPFVAKATAKLTDFGLHCLIMREGTDMDDVYQLTGNTGSLMYMSPEVFRLEPYNEKTDVFSFAVNFWELFNCTLMIARITNMGTQDEIYQYACGVSNGIRPVIPTSWPPRVSALISSCWDPYPHHRPSFSQIVQQLEECRSDVVAMEEKANAKTCCSVM